MNSVNSVNYPSHIHYLKYSANYTDLHFASALCVQCSTVQMVYIITLYIYYTRYVCPFLTGICPRHRGGFYLRPLFNPYLTFTFQINILFHISYLIRISQEILFLFNQLSITSISRILIGCRMT